MSASPTVYIVDDLEDQLELAAEILATAGYASKTYLSGVAFLQEKEMNELGCVLLDNQMPRVSGLDVQRELNKRKIDIPIVFVSGGSDYADVVGAVQSGALGFLQKPYTSKELIEQVQNAISESQRRLDARFNKSQSSKQLQSLTPREVQVYDLVVAGHTNKAISESLAITVGTVEFHRSNLMRKLGATSLAELCQFHAR